MLICCFTDTITCVCIEKETHREKERAMSDQRLTRIAIVSSDKCRPRKCRQECKKSCPVVKTG